MNERIGNRSCDEKERVAEAGRAELTQAASSNGGRWGTGNASAQLAKCSAEMARRTGPDARGLTPR